MKLKKAIEIATDSTGPDNRFYPPGLKDAIRLLVEAGKRVEGARVKGTIWDYSLLPGETVPQENDGGDTKAETG